MNPGAQVAIAVGVWLLGMLAASIVVARWLAARQRLQARLFANDPAGGEQPAGDLELGWLAHWLYTAGYRGPQAAAGFIGATLLCGLLGIALILLLQMPARMEDLARMAVSIPGGTGEVLLPLIYGAPWILGVVFFTLPTLFVRAARRRRVRSVEQDLPIVLELLATLAEAGLGFDAAIDRVLQSLSAQRVLAQELRAFQRDNLAGRPRIDSLRWLARRVAVSWFTVFISAVVQADQIGAGLADVLKIQANDLRQRRKDQALAMASSAPVKLLGPLIICFVPGILTAALGPTLFEVFQALDAVLHRPLR